MQKRKQIAIVLGGTGAATLALGVRLFGSSLPQSGIVLLDWIRHAGVTGLLLFVTVYVLSSLCLVPCLMWNLAAGFVWGLPLGSAVVLPANLVAAVAQFVFGRWVARDWVASRIAKNRRLLALDSALERTGLKIVLLMRVSPISPFALLNYTLGVTRLRFPDFVVASMFGMIPSTVIYVAIGSLLSGAREVLAAGGHPASQNGLLIFGVVSMAGALALLARTARQELNRTIEERWGRSFEPQRASGPAGPSAL